MVTTCTFNHQLVQSMHHDVDNSAHCSTSKSSVATGVARLVSAIQLSGAMHHQADASSAVRWTAEPWGLYKHVLDADCLT